MKMPSAESKTEKQLSVDSTESGNSTPLRQAITIIEHKIRNLEKRKTKLESYRQLQNSGKELNADQKNALDKIGEVVNTLEFAKDLYKQFLGIEVSSEKEAKKQAKREAAVKKQAELARLREILLVQDALNQMGNDNVRDDFLQGRNGAAHLTEADLQLLDDIYPAVTPRHTAGDPAAFANEVQAAAEHLLAVVDGKPKEVFNGSYSQVKEILGKIHESGYFDQDVVKVYENEMTEDIAAAEAPYVDPCADADYAPEEAPLEDPTVNMQPVMQPPPQTLENNVVHPVAPGMPEAVPAPQVMPPAATVVDMNLTENKLGPPPQVPPVVVPQQQQGLPAHVEAAMPKPMPPHPQQVMMGVGKVAPPGGQPVVTMNGNRPLMPHQTLIDQGHLPPEQVYYQQMAPQAAIPPQTQPPVKSLIEMMESASFSFLQDSEIEAPETIPSQIYTNQSFVGTLR